MKNDAFELGNVVARVSQSSQLGGCDRIAHTQYDISVLCGAPAVKLLKRFYGHFAVVVALTLACTPATAAENTDLQLKDGRVLKKAKIVGIGKEQATIVSPDGTISVPLDVVELEDLAYANIRLENEAKDRKKKIDDMVRKEAERRAELIRAGKDREQSVPVSVPNASPSDNRAGKLLALKAKFPPKRRERVAVKSGHIEIDVPHTDVWSYYSGMFHTTTVEALPQTIARVEARRTEDLKAWGQRRADAREPGVSTEARTTVEWLEKDLGRYIEEARKLQSP
jgi:hypothetical protein